MGLMENALLKAVRFKLSRDLGMDSLIADIPVEGFGNIPTFLTPTAPGSSCSWTFWSRNTR